MNQSTQIQPPNSIQQMMQLMQSGSNPASMMQYLMNTNPQVATIMNLVNTKYGGDPKAAFYDLAKQKGVDPNQILSMLKR